jgi:hypothetical protein
MAGQVAVQAVQAVAQDAFVAVEAPLQGGGNRGRRRGHGARIKKGMARQLFPKTEIITIDCNMNSAED